MKAFLLFLTAIILFCISSNEQMKYWEDFNCKQKEDMLNVCKSELIKNLYSKKFILSSDNDNIHKLLKELVTSSDTILPLSFYLFNKICIKSDGALAEIVGKYCVELFVRHPRYIMTYFTKEKTSNIKKPLIKVYAMFVGSELYFERKGTSDLKYNYQSFKEILLSASKGNKENEETFKVFWQLVDETIQNMD